MATGYDDGIIGHGLEPRTLDIKLIKFRSPERNNVDFVFVDTPAFNFNAKTDREILRSDANRLNTLFVALLTNGITLFSSYIGTVSEPMSSWLASCTSTASKNIRQMKSVQILWYSPSCARSSFSTSNRRIRPSSCLRTHTRMLSSSRQCGMRLTRSRGRNMRRSCRMSTGRG